MTHHVLVLIVRPAGVLGICCAGFWQLYVMLTESYTLNRFKDKPLVWVVSLLFFSFSLAVYWLCPNARKKGIVFALFAVGGVVMYVLARRWLPFAK